MTIDDQADDTEIIAEATLTEAHDAELPDVDDDTDVPAVEVVGEPKEAEPRAPTVMFTVPSRRHLMPSFAAWLAKRSFNHAKLNARQLDSMLGLYLSEWLPADLH